jgi:hypothetical protein
MSAKALLAYEGDDPNVVVELALAGGMGQSFHPGAIESGPAHWTRRDTWRLISLKIFSTHENFRRVATRFEKLNERFIGFVYLAGIMKRVH